MKISYEITRWPKFNFVVTKEEEGIKESAQKEVSNSAKLPAEAIEKTNEKSIEIAQTISPAIEKIETISTTKIEEKPIVNSSKQESKTVSQKRIDQSLSYSASINSKISSLIKEEDSQKASKLEQLKEKISKFDQFSFIDCAKNMVFSDGNMNSKLMLIGEAPGQEEDETGKPFVGKSGRLLSDLLIELGLDRSKYYITNVVYWRPPSNRTPTAEEIQTMKPFLLEHISIINPDLIVTVGASATKAMEIEQGITKAQGNVFLKEINGTQRKIFPIYHPSYALRLPMKKKDLWISLIKMFNVLFQDGNSL